MTSLLVLLQFFGLLFLTPGIADAHGGLVDGYGCHSDPKQGNYHCHQGPYAGKSFPSRAEYLTSTAKSQVKSASTEKYATSAGQTLVPRRHGRSKPTLEFATMARERERGHSEFLKFQTKALFENSADGETLLRGVSRTE